MATPAGRAWLFEFLQRTGRSGKAVACQSMCELFGGEDQEQEATGNKSRRMEIESDGEGPSQLRDSLWGFVKEARGVEED